LDERLVQLSNRVNEADATKVRNSIHERIPQPTDDEIAADRSQAVIDEIDSWESLKGGRNPAKGDGPSAHVAPATTKTRHR